jgi:hypothetical protein
MVLSLTRTAQGLWEDRILADRTRRLAARGEIRAGTVRNSSLLVWGIAEELYGIPPSEVQAVIPYNGCTPILSREPSCLGVLVWRGSFYSVIDCGRLMLVATETSTDGHLLLLTAATPRMALSVPRVLGRVTATFGTTGEGALVTEGPPDLLNRPLFVVDFASIAHRLGLLATGGHSSGMTASDAVQPIMEPRPS